MKSGSITTVTGQIASADLGPTLAHEHLWCDISLHSGREDNLLNDVSLMAQELEFFRTVGGQAIIEMTCEGIGRDPAKLKAISQASGVKIIGGIAFYAESTLPRWIREASVEQIADYFVGAIEGGQGGARAGLIGELMSHNEASPDPTGYQLSAIETRIFQAAARAQRQTGVAISTHASLGRGGHAQLTVLEQGGADPRKIAIGHCDAHWHADPERDLPYYLFILERGAYCAFDMIGWNDLAPDQIRAERIARLIQLGYERQLLLSTDTCRQSQLRRNGGRGFDYLWTSFLPRLRRLGVSDLQIHSMLVEAPATLLSRD